MEPKPGYKTTEFWLSLAAVVVGAIMSSGLLDIIDGSVDDQIVGIIATILGALGYTVTRGWTKTAALKADVYKTAMSKDPQ